MASTNRLPTVADLRYLISRPEPPCVSIYLPTRRGGSADDRQRYQGLLRRADELLRTRMKPADADEFLAPIENAADQFWQGQLDGLARFHARDVSRWFALPIEVPELTMVADSFHVRPLLQFLQANQHYWLLSLGQNHVGFFRGNAERLTSVEGVDLPRSLVDAVGLDERQKTISSHSTGGHGVMPTFHGQGKAETAHDEDIARFLRAVDRAIWPVLRDERAPLIIAAAGRLHPTFHSVTRYPHAVAAGIRGNFETAALEELHRRAWPIVADQLAQRQLEVRERRCKAESTSSCSRAARASGAGSTRRPATCRSTTRHGMRRQTTYSTTLPRRSCCAAARCCR